MATSRLVVSIAGAAGLAIFALALVVFAPSSKTPTAVAGPCAEEPLLFFGPTTPFDGIPPLYAQKNKVYVSPSIEVDTVPSQLPDGKDPVTVTVLNTNPGITPTFDPDESDGSFDTTLTVTVGDVEPGLYEFTIRVYCHELETDYTLEVWVDECPANNSSLGTAGNGEPWPEVCATSEETPTPSPTPSPSPTDPAGAEVVWGDHNCSGEPDPVDSLLTLRFDAGLSTNTGACPQMGSQQSLVASNGLVWGDLDCSGQIDPIDALKLLRYDAGLGITQEADCPEAGEVIVIAFG